MNAIQFQFKAKPEDHRIVHDVPKPVPAKDEVLVKVKSSALDTTAKPIIEKEMPMAFFIHKLKDPLYLGYHFSGTIKAVGSQDEVSDLKVGDDVFGFLQYAPSQTQGAFADYITVKHNECAIKPSGIDFDVAAASTTEPVTALQALRDKGGLRKGANRQQKVLVVGAAGGVGSAAVQIAKKLFGAHVTAVSSTKNVEQVKSKFGAHAVIDRSIEPGYVQKLIEEKAQFDVILDAPCVLPSSATKLLKPKGVIVTTAPTGTMYLNQSKMALSSKKATWISCNSNREDLDTIGELLTGEDKLVVPIDSKFKVKDIAKAMAKHADGHNGRVVIQVENGWE